MRLLWRAPMRVEEQGWTRIKAMERISEPIIGRKIGPRSSWTTENGRLPATWFSKRATERLSFSPYGRRIRAGRRPGGPTNQRVRDPVGAESSCATQPVFNGEAKRQNTPREYLPGGRGVIFEFDAQRSISSLVSPAALERAIIKRNVCPRIDSKPAPHKVAKSPDSWGGKRLTSRLGGGLAVPLLIFLVALGSTFGAFFVLPNLTPSSAPDDRTPEDLMP